MRRSIRSGFRWTPRSVVLVLGVLLAGSWGCGASEALTYAEVCQESGGPPGYCECLDRGIRSELADDYELLVQLAHYPLENDGTRLWEQPFEKQRAEERRIAEELGITPAEVNARPAATRHKLEEIHADCGESHKAEIAAAEKKEAEAIRSRLVGEWSYLETIDLIGQSSRSFPEWVLAFTEDGAYSECTILSEGDEIPLCIGGSYDLSGRKIHRHVERGPLPGAPTGHSKAVLHVRSLTEDKLILSAGTSRLVFDRASGALENMVQRAAGSIFR